MEDKKHNSMIKEWLKWVFCPHEWVFEQKIQLFDRDSTSEIPRSVSNKFRCKKCTRSRMEKLF